MRKAIIIDTSILCVWLEVPGKETCGSDSDQWDKVRVDNLLENEKKNKSTVLVLPLATIVETGNHIAQAAGPKRYKTAQDLANLMKAAADEQTPWAAFSEQSELWEAENLKKLADDWPNLANQTTSMGDATIKIVAEHYAQKRYEVVILTGDKGLKAYEPITRPPSPKGRRSEGEVRFKNQNV